MKKYETQRKSNANTSNKKDNSETEVNEINKLISDTKTILNKIIPEISEEKISSKESKKEKYKFRKKEKKEKKIINEANKELKKPKKNKLKDDINLIERICTSKTLKKDLMEIYEKMLENNAEFRDKIFFKNLLDTEKKIGIMDSYKDKEKPISHTFKEIKTENILRNIDNEESLIKKYTLRAQKINDENYEN